MEGKIDIEAFKKNVNGIMKFAESMIEMKRETLSEEEQTKLDKKLEEMNFKDSIKEVKNSTDLLEKLKTKL